MKRTNCVIQPQLDWGTKPDPQDARDWLRNFLEEPHSNSVKRLFRSWRIVYHSWEAMGIENATEYQSALVEEPDELIERWLNFACEGLKAKGMWNESPH